MPWDILFGGVTGLLGTFLTSWNQRKIKELEIKDKAADRQHEVAMVAAETQAMLAETDANIKITEAQVEGAENLQNARTYATLQEVANAPSLADSLAERLFETTGFLAFIAQPVAILICLLLGICDAVKGIARPAITAYLLGLSTWLSMTAWAVLEKRGAPLSALQATSIVEQVIGSVLYLTTVAVTWWFGDRMAAKGLKRLGRG